MILQPVDLRSEQDHALYELGDAQSDGRNGLGLAAGAATLGREPVSEARVAVEDMRQAVSDLLLKLSGLSHD